MGLFALWVCLKEKNNIFFFLLRVKGLNYLQSTKEGFNFKPMHILKEGKKMLFPCPPTLLTLV
jgi:hypothetical protein